MLPSVLDALRLNSSLAIAVSDDDISINKDERREMGLRRVVMENGIALAIIQSIPQRCNFRTSLLFSIVVGILPRETK